MRLWQIFGKFFKKRTPPKNYLALTLEPGQVLASIWTFDQETVRFLGFAQKSFTNVNTLTHQVALAIDQAVQETGDVTKTVFGLSHYWLEAGKLSVTCAKIIKNLSKDLELDPQAYIPLVATVNHLFKIEEGITLQAVLIGYFANFCEVHLLENNRVVATETLKDFQVNSEIISQLISKLKQGEKSLPSRIVLYGQDLSLLRQEFKRVDWQDLFVHEPKTESLSDLQLAKSVAYAQAADILGREPALPTVEKKEIIKDQEVVTKKTDQFGFVEGEDILLARQEEELKTVEEQQTMMSSKAEIVPKEDLAVEIEKEALPSQQEIKESSFPEELVTVGWLPKFFQMIAHPPVKKLGSVLAGLSVMVVLAILIGSLTLTVAEVVIKVNAKPIKKSFEASVVVGAVDNSKSQIAGTEVTAKIEGSQKAVATGSKKIGDKAHGEVKILNWDKQAKTFQTGTEVITKDGLKFILDGDVQIASRSATIPGEAKVLTTAAEIGPKFNIDKGAELTIVGFDEIFYSAVADSDFAGGNEKQATVVSGQDLERLEKSLAESLTEKVTADLKGRTTGQKLHEEAIVVKVLKKEFDKKLDEEASLINLNLEVEASGIVYDDKALKELLAGGLAEEIPANFEARSSDLEIAELTVKKSAIGQKKTLLLTGSFLARLIPRFTEKELAAKIAGKSTKEARAIIKTTPEVADVIFAFSPNLPFIDQLPRNQSKIKFRIQTSD